MKGNFYINKVNSIGKLILASNVRNERTIERNNKNLTKTYRQKNSIRSKLINNPFIVEAPNQSNLTKVQKLK